VCTHDSVGERGKQQLCAGIIIRNADYIERIVDLCDKAKALCDCKCELYIPNNLDIIIHDCAMCDTSLDKMCFVHFLSDVSHRIVQCVTRHSRNHFRAFLSDVSHMTVQCVTRHSRNMLRAFPE
jgi:hypothetical protein